MSELEIALAHAALGREVFPFKLGPLVNGKRKKTPLVKWKAQATTDEATIRGWVKEFPGCLFGWLLPVGKIVADLDDRDAFAASGHVLPEAPMQMTPRGGEHRLYDAEDARQTVVEVPGLDTRVGGKGWVGLYSAEAFVGETGPAPEWLLMKRPTTTTTTTGDFEEVEELVAEGRNNFLAQLGGSIRQAGLTFNEAKDAILRANKERCVPPLSARELEMTVFKSLRTWKRGDGPQSVPTITMRSQRGKIAEQTLADLMAEELPPLTWVVEDLIPAGFGIVASGPKVGKSLLALQIGIGALFGDKVLGHPVVRRPVLLYSLEDGKRVTQARAGLLLDGRVPPPGMAIRYESPRLGSGLEDEIDAWLSDNEDGLVWIDMLARVRPTGRPGRNAYDEDYAALGPLQGVAKRHSRAAVLVNTHDRKAGSDDWTQRITGTRGITGAAEFSIFIDVRPDEQEGELHVSARETGGAKMVVRRAYPRWEPALGVLVKASQPRARVYRWIFENGPAFAKQVGDELGMGRTNVQHLLQELYDDGELVKGVDGYSASSKPTEEDD